MAKDVEKILSNLSTEHIGSEEKGDISSGGKKGCERNLGIALMLDEKTKETLDDIRENKLRVERNMEVSGVKGSEASIDLEDKGKFTIFIPDDPLFRCVVSGENILRDYMEDKGVKMNSEKFLLCLSCLLGGLFDYFYLKPENISKKTKLNLYNDPHNFDNDEGLSGLRSGSVSNSKLNEGSRDAKLKKYVHDKRLRELGLDTGDGDGDKADLFLKLDD